MSTPSCRYPSKTRPRNWTLIGSLVAFWQKGRGASSGMQSFGAEMGMFTGAHSSLAPGSASRAGDATQVEGASAPSQRHSVPNWAGPVKFQCWSRKRGVRLSLEWIMFSF